jgi:2-keto-4-pentenoate hydratase/2-oxohepta-3-ene-1,7-dioic acid hydratase in catechol pathway
VVAGYCLANDVSERVFQIEREGQWTKGKGCETFGPLGHGSSPRTRSDPQNLNMWLDVNGEKRQRGNTHTMIFDCRHIVWCCSQYFALEPGDVIITGTPPGVGLGMAEPKFSGRRRVTLASTSRRAAPEGGEVQAWCIPIGGFAATHGPNGDLTDRAPGLDIQLRSVVSSARSAAVAPKR